MVAVKIMAVCSAAPSFTAHSRATLMFGFKEAKKMQNRLPFLTATLPKHCTLPHSCKATENASNGLVQACFFPLFIFFFGSLFAKNTRVLFTFSLQSLFNGQSHFGLIYSHNRILGSVKN